MTISLWNGLTTKLNKINICEDELKSHLKGMYNTAILFQKMNNKPVQFLTYQITNTRQNNKEVFLRTLILVSYKYSQVFRCHIYSILLCIIHFGVSTSMWSKIHLVSKTKWKEGSIYIENVQAEELISIKNCGHPLCGLKVPTLKFSTSSQKFDRQALIIVYIYRKCHTWRQ